MAANAFLQELGEALQKCRFRDVRELVATFNPQGFDAPEAETTLQSLRQKRLFAELDIAATTFFTAGVESPRLQRLYAQALLDQGRLFNGLAVLRRLEPRVSGDAAEGPEVRGLIGRGLKQRFVDESDPEYLVEAIEAYAVDGQEAPAKNRWHGINLVACLKRAERDGIRTTLRIDADDLARKILKTVEESVSPPVWDKATALEAAVALGSSPDALRWLREYATDAAADAFELGSTLRQLEQIWRIRGTSLGNAIIPVLEYELLQREGGTVGFQSVSNPATGFEAVYGNEASKTLQWLDVLGTRCTSIGRIHDPVSGKPWGTGFLVSGSVFAETWGSEVICVTNSHVVSPEQNDLAPLRPESAAVEFTRIEGRPRVSLGEVLYSSPRAKLDITVTRIHAPKGVIPIAAAPFVPTAGGADAARVYVAGHPQGRELEVTLYDNNLHEIEDPFARYRCPTEGGSSGSPVFNGQWEAFALHHRADDKRQLNEGILLKSVRDAIKTAESDRR